MQKPKKVPQQAKHAYRSQPLAPVQNPCPMIRRPAAMISEPLFQSISLPVKPIVGAASDALATTPRIRFLKNCWQGTPHVVLVVPEVVETSL